MWSGDKEKGKCGCTVIYNGWKPHKSSDAYKFGDHQAPVARSHYKFYLRFYAGIAQRQSRRFPTFVSGFRNSLSAPIWGMGLLGVVTSFAWKKNSRVQIPDSPPS